MCTWSLYESLSAYSLTLFLISVLILSTSNPGVSLNLELYLNMWINSGSSKISRLPVITWLWVLSLKLLLSQYQGYSLMSTVDMYMRIWCSNNTLDLQLKEAGFDPQLLRKLWASLVTLIAPVSPSSKWVPRYKTTGELHSGPMFLVRD